MSDNLQEKVNYSSLASNVLTPVLVAVGILITMYFSSQSLREIQLDRELRSREMLNHEQRHMQELHLAEENLSNETMQYVNFAKSSFSTIVKKEPKVVDEIGDSSENRFGYEAVDDFLELKNFGRGSAHNLRLFWTGSGRVTPTTPLSAPYPQFDPAEKVSEKHRIHFGFDDLIEPDNLLPNETASIRGLPYGSELARFEPLGATLETEVLLEYQDSHGKRYTSTYRVLLRKAQDSLELDVQIEEISPRRPAVETKSFILFQ